MQQVIVILIQLCQLILVTSALDLSFHSINTTASYNHASGTYYVAPDESFSIGCTYINLPVTLTYGEVSWRVGPYGEYPPHKLVTKGVIQSDPVVKAVNPLRVPQSEDHPLVNGTIWLTLYQASKELYTADNPALTYLCDLAVINGTTVASSQQLNYKTFVNISVVAPLTNVSVRVTPPNGQITVGDDVSFECLSDGYPGPNHTWSKEGENAVEVAGFQHSGRFLNLTSVTNSTAGTYICTATDERNAKTVSSSVSVKIFERATIVDILVSPLEYQIIHHATLSLKCVVKGFPAPTVKWYREDGGDLIGSRTAGPVHIGSSVRLLDIDYQSTATYICSAQNNVTAVAQTRSIDILVKYYVNNVTVTLIAPTGKIIEGDEVTLNCTALGIPKPNFTWSREDGADLVNTESAGTKHEGSVLRFVSITAAAAAVYICSAKNFERSQPVTAQFVLTVNVPASITEINVTPTKENITENGDVALKCIVNGIPIPTVTWYRKDGEELVDTENGGLQYVGSTLRLQKITEAAAAEYVCSAINEVTDVAVEKSFSIEVFTFAKVVSVTAKSFSSKFAEGDNVTLECVVEGLPTPSVTWTREDGKTLVGSENGGLQHRGLTLTLRNVQTDATASYTCSAKNRVTEVARTKAVRVQVYQLCLAGSPSEFIPNKQNLDVSGGDNNNMPVYYVVVVFLGLYTVGLAM